jgi:hypothetical protein
MKIMQQLSFYKNPFQYIRKDIKSKTPFDSQLKMFSVKEISIAKCSFLKLFFQISFLTSCLILYTLFQIIKYSLYDTLKWESLCITITFNSVYFTYFQHYITYKHKRKWSCNALYKQWSTHMRMRMMKTMRM